MIHSNEKKFYHSTTQAAYLLGISRQAVVKKINNGNLKAVKVGRNFIIANEEIQSLLGSGVTTEQKQEIEIAVKKAVKQYSKAFRRLGREE